MPHVCFKSDHKSANEWTQHRNVAEKQANTTHQQANKEIKVVTLISDSLNIRDFLQFVHQHNESLAAEQHSNKKKHATFESAPTKKRSSKKQRFIASSNQRTRCRSTRCIKLLNLTSKSTTQTRTNEA